MKGVSLPAIFKKAGEQLEVWIDAEAMNACRNIADSKQLMGNKPAKRAGTPTWGYGSSRNDELTP